MRYADDLMILATSREELVSMVEMLVQELSLIGLQLNGTKTKVLTTSTLQEASYVEICGTMVAILHGGMTHKYLGRKFPGNLNSRTEVEIMHRIKCAWHNFHQHKLILLNKHVCLRLRLKLFHATVFPTAMFGLSSLALTQKHLHKLDVVQRRMLRSIVGWVRILAKHIGTSILAHIVSINLWLKQFPTGISRKGLRKTLALYKGFALHFCV